MSYKKTAKLITIVFTSLIIIQTFGFLFLYVINEPASAAIKFKLQVPFPGMDTVFGTNYNSATQELTIEGNSIGNYIKTVYNYAIGTVGILATVTMIFGGIIWITAAGNTSRVETAKSTISAALTGMVLALSSYFILNMLNPDLLTFKPLDLTKVGNTVTCCSDKRGIITPKTKTQDNELVYYCEAPEENASYYGNIDTCTYGKTCEKNDDSNLWSCVKSPQLRCLDLQGIYINEFKSGTAQNRCTQLCKDMGGVKRVQVLLPGAENWCCICNTPPIDIL